MRTLGPVAVVLVLLLSGASFGSSPSQFLSGFVHLILFAIVALAAHRRLAGDRPTPAHLTQFFLLVSLGGALGGAFNSFVAPFIFDRAIEYFLVLALAIALFTPRKAITDLSKVITRGR